MGLFRNLPGILSFLLILTLSYASSRATKIEILNNCTYTVWAAAFPGGGRQLKQGETWTLNNITGEGRIWGRTNCAFGNGGRGKCESGDCNGLLECQANGRAPNTLAVYSINEPSYYEQDVFSISVLEGFNVPMEFSPAESSNCSEMSKCAADVNGPCPMELRDPGGCNSPCTVFNNSQFCCTSGICEPTSYSNFFKVLCQEASAFPDYDYRERRFCPTGSDYRVVFCPSTMNKPGNNDVGSIITRTMFDQMLKHRNDRSCPSRGFYTYDSFLTAARFFDGFGTTGNDTTRKRELAAFFGQTSHETTGGLENAPDGPYAWGYCFAEETNQDTPYCTVTDNTGPCTPGKKYYGRGPFQLSWNYNYKAAGEALGFDLLNDPDLVATDPVVSFKTAIWFWMTSQEDNRSCHDIIVGTWKPTLDDKSVGRVPGYGAITNIINGALECGKGQNDRVASRIGFYKRYCDILGVTYGNNLDCYSQRPFSSGSA